MNDAEAEQHTPQDVEGHDVDEHREDESVTGAVETVECAAPSVLQENLVQDGRQAGSDVGLQRYPEEREGGLHDEEGGEELVEEERDRGESAEEDVEVVRGEPGEDRGQEGEGGESVVVAGLGALRLERILEQREPDREVDGSQYNGMRTVRHLTNITNLLDGLSLLL